MHEIKSRKIIVEKNPNLKRLSTIIVFVIIAFSFGALLFFNLGPTGNVAFSIETNYDPNSTLEGKMSLSLKPGELIPKDSVITISMENSSYDFVLSDLVSESVVKGDFYGEGLVLSGSGEGYGIPGVKETFPEVDFVMKVSKGSSDSASKSEETEEESSSEGSNQVETEEENNSEVIEETAEDETEETDQEESSGGSEEQAEETIEVDETDTEEVSAEAEESVDEKEAEKEEKKEEKAEAKEDKKSEDGSVLTGDVVATLENEISGTVSGEKEYTYEISPGEKAEIVSSSKEVSISQKGNTVTVTTSYSEKEEGFGADYLGEDYEYELEVDLSALELTVEEGELIASLIYSDIEIASVSTTLSVEDPNQISSIVTVSPLEQESISDFALNDEETFALKSKTGVDVAEIVKSEEFNNRLIIRFVAGNYWLENSYDSDLDDLKYQIELDRAKFMKRLSKSFLAKEEPAVSVEDYLGTESLISIEETPEEVVSEEVEETVSEEEVSEAEEEAVVEETTEEVSETEEEIIEEIVNDSG